MIVRPKPNLIGVLTSLKGSIAKRIALRSLLVTLLASAIVLIETLHPSYFSKVSATPFTLLGLSLSIFMSFRNNACYDRWYEARKAWGEIIVDIRSMIRETQIIKDAPERHTILGNLCGFAHALNARLAATDAQGQHHGYQRTDTAAGGSAVLFTQRIRGDQRLALHAHGQPFDQSDPCPGSL